jgi:ferredoxin
MDKPCIVCEENCPVSPKAIFTRKHFSPLRGSPFRVEGIQRMDSKMHIMLGQAVFEPNALATGDHYLRTADRDSDQRYRIVENAQNTVSVFFHQETTGSLEAGRAIEIEIQLKRPFVDLQRCIGCGICEHECPVKGLRAIRVTAENESRHRDRALLLPSG